MEVSAEEQSHLLPNEAENIVVPEKLLQIVVGRPTENWDPGLPMPRVPPLLRQAENSQHDYDPVVVSLGPYHHGKMELQLVEDFKMTALQMFVNRSGKDAGFLYSQVFHGVTVNDARNCYIKDSTEQYDDATFAQMMLLDACFLVMCISSEIFGSPGLDDLYLEKIFRDMILLENQIPFWLLKLLICLAYGKEEGENKLNLFLHVVCFGHYEAGSRTAWRNDKELPHHLLDACWRLPVLESPTDKSTTPESRPGNESGCLNHLPNFGKCCNHLLHKYASSVFFHWNRRRINRRRNDNDLSTKGYIHSFRSAMDLKAKGIHFRPSSADSLRGIKFKSGYFHATLEVPVKVVGIHTRIFFLNMTAYEMCAKTSEDRVVTAYIDFMKTLIDGPNDVKELREKRILLTKLGSDEEVANVYKGIKSNGVANFFIFHDVGKEIEDHYNNKAKTWLAELLYAHFRSPWKVIGLIAAFLLLVLNFLQTYYTAKSS